MLLWVPEGTDVQYLSDLPDTIEVGFLPSSDRVLAPEAGRVEFLIAPFFRDVELFQEQLRQMTSLRVIQTYSAGVDRLVAYVPPGVVLCNGKGLHDSAVAEWIVAAILAAYNRFDAFFALQQQGTYRPVTTDTLEGDTVTILGYGSIGESVETRLSGFGINIQRVGRSSRTRSDGKQIHSFKELGGILPTTNVLVVLVPLTSETDGMIDRHLLAQLPTGSLVINAGRGKTVRTDDLIAELSTGRLRAVLDVTEPEPIPDGHPLWTTPNLLLTQHSSGDSSDYLDKVYPFINEQLRRYTSGEPLLNVVEGEY